MLKQYYPHFFRTSIRGRGITSATGMGCEFRRTTSQKTEAERRAPQPIGFAKPHPSEGRASERHLLGVIMASGSFPGNGPVLDPAMKHTFRS
jgi:hypothetical protein